MRRTGFSRKTIERKPSVPIPMRGPVRGVLAPASDEVRAAPKENPVQNEAYMAAVRTLRCAHCGYPPPSQFCHSDEGKGGMLKTDCRRGWPGCGPRLGEIGCHALLGSTGKLGKETRRALEDLYSMRARVEVRSRGLWPASLPEWTEA